MSEASRQARSRLLSRGVQAGFVLVLLAAWYLGTTFGHISPILLPNPVNVFDELMDVLRTGEFIDDLQVTLGEVAAAFSISATTGVALGYLISRSQYSIRVFEPLFAGIYAVPIILFLPLYVLFFGLGPASKIALGVTTSFLPSCSIRSPGSAMWIAFSSCPPAPWEHPNSSCSAGCCCRRHCR